VGAAAAVLVGTQLAHCGVGTAEPRREGTTGGTAAERAPAAGERPAEQRQQRQQRRRAQHLVERRSASSSSSARGAAAPGLGPQQVDLWVRVRGEPFPHIHTYILQDQAGPWCTQLQILDLLDVLELDPLNFEKKKN
jgi:hypothetical protein